MRYLNVDGEINEQNMEALLLQLRKPESSHHIFVDSPGGRFKFFDTIGPAIENQGVVTLAGDVYSSAIVLYLLGYRRQAFPDSTFFFHEVSALVDSLGKISIATAEEVLDYASDLSKGATTDEYQIWLANMKAAQHWLLSFLTRKTNIPNGTFLNLMRNKVTLTAWDAMQYGIVTEIIPSPLD